MSLKSRSCKIRSRPKAVVFDMDGVIVDSMPYHYLAWYEALRPYGVRVTCFDVYSKEGEQWQKSVQGFLKKSGIDPTAKLLNEIFKSRQKIFYKYFKLHIFDRAEDTIVDLKKKGFRLALVTGTPDDLIKKILPMRIYRMFEYIVAGNHVKKGKPHPAPYLKAAKMLGIKPSECMVVENAPYGIESAKRAGMYCVAISTSLPDEYLTKADRIVTDISDVRRIIG